MQNLYNLRSGSKPRPSQARDSYVHDASKEAPTDRWHGALPFRILIRLSGALLAVERLAIGALMALLTGLILLNVVTRYARVPIYWIDESAIYAVVWLTFIGASAMTRLRLDFAVTMLTERLASAHARIAQVVATASIVAFGVALAAMCWVWMDPIGIASAGFDARELAARTFNFLYTERTQTLSWPTWVVSLIMPIFAVSITLHGAANILEDLGLVPRSAAPGLAGSSAEAVS